MDDKGNVSIQESFTRFKKQIKFASPVDHFSVSSPCSNNKVKSQEENTVSSSLMGAQFVPEVLDSVLSSESFSTEELLFVFSAFL